MLSIALLPSGSTAYSVSSTHGEVRRTEIQKQLISAALDDFTPNAALPHTNGGQFGPNADEWRKAVIAFVRDMIAAGLITPLPGREGYHLKGAEEVADLLRHGDESVGVDRDLLWDVIHFTGTEKLATLLRGAGLDNWQARNADLSLQLGKQLEWLGAIYP